MTRKLTAAIFAALFAGSIALSGCKEEGGGGGGKSADGAERVGVVNLDQVAIDLGWKAKIETNAKTQVEQLQKELVQVAATYRQQLADKKKSFAPGDKDPLTAEQQQTLIQMINNYNQIIQALDQQAGKSFQEYSQVSMGRYRDALMPIVRQVAQEKHVGVVLTPMAGNPVYVDPAVDITNAVVDAARKNEPKITEVPMAHLNLTNVPADLPSTLPTPSATQPSAGGSATKPTTNPSK